MPTLFSGAVESKRNLVGFIWSMVMAITITCTVATFVYSSRVRAGYAKNAMLGGYGYDDGGNRNDDAYYGYQDDGNGNNNNNNGGSGDRNEDFYYIYYLLASVKSIPLLICTMYSSVLVGLVTLYGSAYVVGFVGPTGRYVKPFLAKGGSNSALHLGIFVGMLFVFANLSLVCALIFSNIWVRFFLDLEQTYITPSTFLFIHTH